MCWPKAKQRRAVGWGATKAFTKIGTSGGMGRGPCSVFTGLRKAWSTGASHDSARSKPAATPRSRISLASASCSGYSVGMWSSTLSNASAWSWAMRCTLRPMRTQMAGTQLNENALRWSSATTIEGVRARAPMSRSPMRAISAMTAVTVCRPAAPQARS